MPLNAAIGQVCTLYCPGGCHGHQFWLQNQVVALWYCFSEASIQKARNGLSTQHIKATSCIKRMNATIGAEHLSNFCCYQMLKMHRNWWSYQTAMKIVKKWMVMTVNSCWALRSILCHFFQLWERLYPWLWHPTDDQGRSKVHITWCLALGKRTCTMSVSVYLVS